MRFRSRPEPPPALSVNVTSMVDVMMVLVVFLLGSWASTMIENDVSIRLPSSHSGAHRRTASPVILNVRASGEIVINGRSLDDPAATQLLKRLVEVNPNQIAVVRADRTTPYSRILEVLGLCSDAGVSNLSFAGDKPAAR